MRRTITIACLWGAAISALMILPAALFFADLLTPNLIHPFGDIAGALLAPGWLASMAFPTPTTESHLHILIAGLSWAFWSVFLALGTLPFVYIVRRDRQAHSS